MHDHYNDIERIVNNGFARLPVDETTTAKAIGAVVRCGNELHGTRKVLSLRRIESSRIYALAATLALSFGIGYLAFHGLSSSVDKKVVEGTPHGEDRRCGVTVVSAVSDTETDSALLRSAGDEFTTGKSSQLLLAMGMRTQTVLFERSDVRVERADSLRTTISLDKGTIAVDIAPGGHDTVSIITAYGSFTQLGTRFSVSIDSIKGASVEVYRGSVRVRDVNGSDIILAAGRAWRSRNDDTVTTVRRNATELEELERVFSYKKLERLLRREQDVPIHSAIMPEKPFSRKQLPKGRATTSAGSTTIGVVRGIGVLAERGDFHAIDSAVALLGDPSIADTVAGMLLTMAQRKKDLFRFIDAQRLLEAVAGGAPFTTFRREDASVRRYMLFKTHIDTEPDDLLKELRRHRDRFPAGAFGEDMAAEAIALLMSLKKYDEAAAEMKGLLLRYPRHPQNDYYRYLLASTLRENLHRDVEALAEYKRYAAMYPNGKYEEDALYWIIQISRASRDVESAARLKKTYLQKYPRGRWVEEVRTIDVSVWK